MSRTFAAALLLATAFTAFAADQHSEACPPQFAYCGWSGLQQWANIPGSDCGGKKQSPVNITGWKTVHTRADIEVRYGDSTATVSNTGHDIKVKPATANNIIRVNGTDYPLVDFHFHTPSEHHLRGREFAGEVHFVHLLDGHYVVIAVLLPAQETGSSVFAPVFRSLPRNVCTSAAIDLAWEDLLPKRITTYYTYDGSLTTPPCREAATFYIARETKLVLSNADHGSLRALGENARRPLQDINRRPITLVDPR